MYEKGINKQHDGEIWVNEYVNDIAKCEYKDILREVFFSKRPINSEKNYHHYAKFQRKIAHLIP